MRRRHLLRNRCPIVIIGREVRIVVDPAERAHLRVPGRVRYPRPGRCVVCDEPFVRLSHNARICSDACRATNRINWLRKTGDRRADDAVFEEMRRERQGGGQHV